MYPVHHRPDIQHSVDTLVRLMRNLMITAIQKLKKLIYHLLGTSDRCQENCAVLTWARTQNTRALSSAEVELYAIGSGTIKSLGPLLQFLKEWQYKTVPLPWTNLNTASICKRM